MRNLRVKSKLSLILLFLCTAFWAGAGELSATLLYKVQLGNHDAPADVVLESDGSAGIYDAFNGSYTTYKNGKKQKEIKQNVLKGGNCFVKNGNYYLFCNSQAKQVNMFSADMDHLFASFSLPEDIKGDYDPTDALVAGGYLFTVDNDNHRVIKTDLASKKVELTVGGFGKEKLAFWYPYSIAIDKKGVLFISEVLNTRVQKITTDLKFYEFFGAWGVNPGQFYRPTGIAIYKDETLLVADGYTGVIQYLDEDGRFAGILKDNSGKKLTFESVTHIRIKGNRLAIVDAFAKSVYVYELGEQN